MSGFSFNLERRDGTPADPSTFKTAVPNGSPGDTIPLGRGRNLRVVAIHDDDADQPPTLVVEDLSWPATGERVA